MRNILQLIKVADQTSGRVPVEIPAVLIERLKPFGPRFVKVETPRADDKNSGKAAVEREWQNHPYEADSTLQEWLSVGGNYGIMAGSGIIIVETDTPATSQKLEAHKTFTVKSGSGRGFHRFYRSDVTENGVLIDCKTGENFGNVQARNKYVVGPNCHHYTGGTYKIVDKSPIEWISKQEIEETFGELLSWTGQRRKEIEEETASEQEQLGTIIPIKELIDTSKMSQLANREYQGTHPIHGSETGQNFCINTERNLWHCFRCNSGGGSLMWIAVKNGIIKCHEAQKGVLKGRLFMQTLKAARQEGFEIQGYQDDNEELSPDVNRFFEQQHGKQVFRAAYVANELMKEHTYATRRSDEIMFRYEPSKGIYELYGEVHIQSQTLAKLGKYTSINRQREVLNFIQKRTYKDLADAPTNFIVVKNGVLNLQTCQLEPHSPEYFILNSLNVNYDPKADCPKFKKFLNEVVTEGDLATIQEFAGYCLHRLYNFHSALLLVGEGANGKSTFLECLRALLGNENVSNESLQVLQNNRFAVSQLYGKLANVYADLPAIALKETGIFKMLTGGDTISGEHKFKPIFNFINYAKLIFSCNQIPQTPDDTDAFYRRWIIINFPHQFLTDDPNTDKELRAKLTTTEELSGILNWALEGLKRLLTNKRFTASKSVEETKQQYIQSADPIRAFTEECLTLKANAVIPKDDVYNAYVMYCQKHSLPATTKNAFSMNLPKYIPTTPSKTSMLGKQVNTWRGIIIKDSRPTEATTIYYSNKLHQNENESNSEEEQSVASVGSNENDGTLEDFPQGED